MLPDKIDPATLGFDFDGVIADTAEAFLRLACEEYGHCEVRLEDITHFEVAQCLQIKDDIIETIFRRILLDSVGSGLKPMPDALEVLGQLSEKAVITLITARTHAQPVHDWLATVLPASTIPRLNVVAMGSHDDKEHYIRGEGLRYFIDDRVETCLRLHEVGLAAIVFQQPWNKGRHSLPSVRGWTEIRELCL